MFPDSSLAPDSVYFKYYLHLALSKSGLGDDYLSWLDIWRKNIELGLTTWGASPNIEFFRIILGIESNASRFEGIRI